MAESDGDAAATEAGEGTCPVGEEEGPGQGPSLRRGQGIPTTHGLKEEGLYKGDLTQDLLLNFYAKITFTNNFRKKSKTSLTSLPQTQQLRNIYPAHFSLFS